MTPGAQASADPSIGGSRQQLARIASRALRTAGAALLALLLVSLTIEALGADAPTALEAILNGALGSPFSVGQTVMLTAVLTLTGLAAAIPFSARMFNVGAEGQLYVGALAATAVGLGMPSGSPQALVVALLLLAGILAGAFWAAIPGVMKAVAGANEVIVSLMLTFVAALLADYATVGIWPSGLALNTQSLPANALLPTISHSSGITLGAPLAVVAVAVCWLIMYRGTLGFEIRATGLNVESAELSGIPVRRVQILSFVIGGAAAGLGGAILVAGIDGSLISGGASGYGFLGIAVALVARLSPAWLIPAAFLFAGLQIGSNGLQVAAGLSSSMGSVLIGVFVIALLALGVIRLEPAEGSG